jgi:hypothetical protein
VGVWGLANIVNGRVKCVQTYSGKLSTFPVDISTLPRKYAPIERDAMSVTLSPLPPASVRSCGEVCVCVCVWVGGWERGGRGVQQTNERVRINMSHSYS